MAYEASHDLKFAVFPQERGSGNIGCYKTLDVIVDHLFRLRRFAPLMVHRAAEIGERSEIGARFDGKDYVLVAEKL